MSKVLENKKLDMEEAEFLTAVREVNKEFSVVEEIDVKLAGLFYKGIILLFHQHAQFSVVLQVKKSSKLLVANLLLYFNSLEQDFWNLLQTLQPQIQNLVLLHSLVKMIVTMHIDKFSVMSFSRKFPNSVTSWLVLELLDVKCSKIGL